MTIGEASDLTLANIYAGPFPAPKPRPRNERVDETGWECVSDEETGDIGIDAVAHTRNYITGLFVRGRIDIPSRYRTHRVRRRVWRRYRITTWTEPGGQRMGRRETIDEKVETW